MKKPLKKTIAVDQAVGMVLPHDITEIVKDGFKGRAFKKGHIIRQEDVEHLKRLGKENIYVLTLDEGEIHENEAAEMLARSLAGTGTTYPPEPVEGKISIKAACDGLLKIDVDRLLEINLLGEVMCATLQNNTPVSRGEQIAGTRLIPLVGSREVVERAVTVAESGEHIIQVLPLKKVRAGLVITGNEVFYGRIEDKFEQVLRTKLKELGSEVAKVCFAPDDVAAIATEIKSCLQAGVELVVTSGGMSVDPDDVTRLGIAEAGAVDICYGTPVLPGAMFLAARIGDVPILGLPACGMFHRITVFDLILPRILTGERIGRREFAALGHGGLCRNCQRCQYPVCSFGKS